MVVDFRRTEPRPLRSALMGPTFDIVDSYKYLGVVLDTKLE